MPVKRGKNVHKVLLLYGSDGKLVVVEIACGRRRRGRVTNEWVIIQKLNVQNEQIPQSGISQGSPQLLTIHLTTM